MITKQPFVHVSCDTVPIIDMDSSSPLKVFVDWEVLPIGNGSIRRTTRTYANLNITLGEFNDSYNGTNDSHIIWVASPNYSISHH